jgi:hypothetical protein
MAGQLVEIELQVPLQNIVPGGKREFKAGETLKVTEEIAEDLKRREKEYLAYERSLIRDNGSMVEAGKIVGGTNS